MALAQTGLAAETIKAAFPDAEIETVTVRTRGDKIQNRPLDELGGGGVFVSEIEKALLEGRIDIGVHSAKDLPVKLGHGLEIPGVLKRGDCRDAIVAPKGHKPENRPEYIIGTGSVRRRLTMMRFYPNIGFAGIRGNVDTRIRKMLDGEYDGVILAMAGLERLGLYSDDTIEITPFDCHDFMPAPCQGIIALETRAKEFSDVIRRINNEAAYFSFQTERRVMELLNAPCSVPLGAYSYTDGEIIYLTVSADTVNKVTGEADTRDRFLLAERLVSGL